MAVVRSGECRFKMPLQVAGVQKYRGPTLAPDRLYSVEDLAAAARRLAQELPSERFGVVIGLARSGLVPAAIIASLWHKPMLVASPTTAGVSHIGHGWRLKDAAQAQQPLMLLVDDSAAYGSTIRHTVERLERSLDVRLIKTAVCFAAPEALDVVDYAANILSRPHYFEWCLANTGWIRTFAFDFDGVICEDPTMPDSTPEYQRFLQTARPYLLPLRHEVTIITARHESHREATMEWLRRHGVNVRRLMMWEDDAHARWATPDRVAMWKADCLLKLRKNGITGYIESDEVQARLIADKTGFPVICTSAKRVFNQRLHEWWRADQ